MNESNFLSAAFYVYLISSFCYAYVFFKNSPRVKQLAGKTLIIGLTLHAIALVIRWKTSGHAPFSNMYESLIFFSWCFVLAYFITERTLHIYRLGFSAMIFNLMLLGYAFSHDATIKPLMPALQSNWMILHVITCFLSYGAFAISFLASLIFLLPHKNKKFSTAQLDSVMYRAILFGFPLLTLGVASGAVWANEAWGTYWSWDPKETWALITWFIYALYLHLRLKKEWEGKKLAWVAFFGFLSVIFTYVGVSYILAGLHSYN